MFTNSKLSCNGVQIERLNCFHKNERMWHKLHGWHFKVGKIQEIDSVKPIGSVGHSNKSKILRIRLLPARIFCQSLIRKIQRVNTRYHVKIRKLILYSCMSFFRAWTSYMPLTDWTESMAKATERNLTRRPMTFINTYILQKLAFIPTISPNDFFNKGLELPDALSVGPCIVSILMKSVFVVYGGNLSLASSCIWIVDIPVNVFERFNISRFLLRFCGD